MTPTKLLIGQILIVFAIVILGLWASTQWAASMLGYQPRLGAPWFIVGELPVYRPWALFGWWRSRFSHCLLFDPTSPSGVGGDLTVRASSGGRAHWKA